MNLGYDSEQNNRLCFEDKQIQIIFSAFACDIYSRFFDLLDECKCKAIMRFTHPLARQALKRIKKIEKETRTLLLDKQFLENIDSPVNLTMMNRALEDREIEQVIKMYANKIKKVFRRLQRRQQRPQQHDET